AWRIVLRRFSGQDEFVLGTTSGHRPPGAEHAVGYFVSLLPLRARVTDDLELREAVRTARDVVFAATEHSRVDQDVLLAEVNPDPGTARPLTPVSIDLDTEALPATGLPGLRAEPVADGAMSAPLELALMVVRSGSGLRLRIRYDSALYDESTVRRYLAQLDLVLAAMAEGHATRVGELPVLTAADEKQLRAFGTGEQPGAPARLELTYPATVVEGDQAHDSAELRSAAGSVTARLRELGVRRGDVVAVALPRGFDFAAAVLGTVAAGAAYLPLDLAQPRPRLAAMLADAAPVALVGAADL
ncbi:non-ribosomal peptide synthetase, partial [Crossiella equi]